MAHGPLGATTCSIFCFVRLVACFRLSRNRTESQRKPFPMRTGVPGLKAKFSQPCPQALWSRIENRSIVTSPFSAGNQNRSTVTNLFPAGHCSRNSYRECVH